MPLHGVYKELYRL